jgi:hypothetical protein
MLHNSWRILISHPRVIGTQCLPYIVYALVQSNQEFENGNHVVPFVCTLVLLNKSATRGKHACQRPLMEQIWHPHTLERRLEQMSAIEFQLFYMNRREPRCSDSLQPMLFRDECSCWAGTDVFH